VKPIARAGLRSNAMGPIRCENPVRVVRIASGSPAATRAKPRLIETPGRRGSGRQVGSGKRAGGARVKTRAKPQPEYPERVKPKGASGGGRTNPAVPARDSRKGQSPEAAARWAGPGASAPGNTDGRNGVWVHPRGNAVDTFREEKAPKGESQERCRHETRLARAWRE